MTIQLKQAFKTGIIVPAVLILTGFTLLINMIAEEGEPGAIPLFVSIAGIIWLTTSVHKIRYHRR